MTVKCALCDRWVADQDTWECTRCERRVCGHCVAEETRTENVCVKCKAKEPKGSERLKDLVTVTIGRGSEPLVRDKMRRLLYAVTRSAVFSPEEWEDLVDVASIFRVGVEGLDIPVRSKTG